MRRTTTLGLGIVFVTFSRFLLFFFFLFRRLIVLSKYFVVTSGSLVLVQRYCTLIYQEKKIFACLLACLHIADGLYVRSCTFSIYNRRYRHLKVPLYMNKVGKVGIHYASLVRGFFFLQTNESLVVRGHGLY